MSFFTMKKSKLVIIGLLLSLLVFFLSTILWIPTKDDFWVTRNNASMPVWVRGNISSGIFVIFNHGGPGSSGTLESIIEVNPGNGKLGNISPINILEEQYAVVYWDQRASGMSRGDVDPDDNRPDDFGEDLAVVINEVQKRYNVKSLFLLGQSWGHFVASNYLSSVESWQLNQDKISGYIAYKGNHSQQIAYETTRKSILSDVKNRTDESDEIWEDMASFYFDNNEIKNVTQLEKHNTYIDLIMGTEISLFNRILSSVKASIVSPFNGWKYYFNNKKNREATVFLEWVATDRSMEEKISRIEIPTLIFSGRNDLVSPVEVGKHIYDKISTTPENKQLIILENSRHGAENSDVAIFQEEITNFINRYKNQ